MRDDETETGPPGEFHVEELDLEEVLAILEASDANGLGPDDADRAWGAFARSVFEHFNLRCGACEYPLTGVPVPKCPECGRAVTSEDIRWAVIPPPAHIRYREADAFWNFVRMLGGLRAWIVLLGLWVVASLFAATGRLLGPADTILFAAFLCFLSIPLLTYIEHLGRQVDIWRYTTGRSETLELVLCTFWARTRGLVAAFSFLVAVATPPLSLALYIFA